MNRALSFVLVVLVVASAALNVLLFRRQKEIERRLGEIEKKPAPAAIAKTTGSDPEIRTFTEPKNPGDERYSETPTGPRRIERKDDSATDAGTSTLPADLRAAIAKEVEAQLKKSGKLMTGAIIKFGAKIKDESATPSRAAANPAPGTRAASPSRGGRESAPRPS